jgi:phosphatidate cytidylyltransferase
MTSQFRYRLLFGVLGTAGVFLSLYYSFSEFFKPILILLHVAIVWAALSEYYELARHKEFAPLKKLGIASSVCFIIALDLSLQYPCCKGIPQLILLGSFISCFLAFFTHRTSPLGNLAVTVFGIVYLTIPLGCALMINYFFSPEQGQDGRLWLLYVLVVSKVTDVGAYFVGKGLGNTKLAPWISPKKTVEGAIGGFISALAVSFIFVSVAKASGAIALSFVQNLWLSITITILAQLGDLTESLLKRDAGVKDSSRLPGFGGILDVIDSLVFTLPFMYLVLYSGLI